MDSRAVGPARWNRRSLGSMRDSASVNQMGRDEGPSALCYHTHVNANMHRLFTCKNILIVLLFEFILTYQDCAQGLRFSVL